jgi:hypothetical protein
MSSLEFALVDSEFKEVGHGIGKLDVDVPPGIYELEYQAGPSLGRRLINLEPGEVYQDQEIELEFPSPAPIDGTSTSHEYQQDAARNASQTSSAAGTGPASLVIMVRNLRGFEDLPFDRSTIAPIELMGNHLEPFTDFKDGWQLDSGAGWATWSGRLAPGGVALRATRWIEQKAQPVIFDQSLWLTAGWQTLVFISNSSEGALPESASVHMARVGVDWSPYEREVGQAVELALWSLRQGRSQVPPDLMNLLLGSKFQNPMLGVLGAHSLLLSPKPDLELIDKVVGNLEGLVPGHPDVAALRWLAAEARSDRRVPRKKVPGAPVEWPPMLQASYAALIRKDANDGETIVDGSVAERAAAQLVNRGVWTAWEPLERPKPAPLKPVKPFRLPPPKELEAIRRAPIADPATKKVARYIADVAEVRKADFSKVLEEVDSAQVGVAAGLPSASVKRALTEIREGYSESGDT